MGRYYLDTEFNGFGGQLISLALVSADGRKSFYLATECKAPVQWVAENVIPIIEASPYKPIYLPLDQWGRAIALFLGDDEGRIEVIVDWPDDIRYFCEVIISGPGQMVSIPGLSFHMVRADAYPTELGGAVQHNAWWDAQALRFALEGPATPSPNNPHDRHTRE